MKSLTFSILVVVFLVASCAPAGNIPSPGALQPTSTLTSVAMLTDTPESMDTPIASATPSVTVIPTVEFTSSPPAVCRVEPIIPDMDTLAENNVPSASETDRAYGTSTPKVTILSYCSYQRTACRSLINNLAELQQMYADEVCIVLRQYPQPEVDDKSLLAAYAAEAAGLENRFWEMNTLLYSQQADWVDLTPDKFKTWLADQSSSLNIEPAQLEVDMANEEVTSRVDRMIEEAAPLLITDTPVLFFNNILVKTSVNLESLAVLVDYFMLPEKAYSACPPTTIDIDKEYFATFATEKGVIVFELFADIAPVAVNSFVFLANEGWYDDSTFFRVIPGFVAQGGDPSNSGLGAPGYAISREVDPSLRFDKAGLLALSHNSEGLSGSQFFVTYTELPELDGEFTIIGQVVEGMDVLNSLRPRNPEVDDILLPADVLISVTIEEK